MVPRKLCSNNGGVYVHCNVNLWLLNGLNHFLCWHRRDSNTGRLDWVSSVPKIVIAASMICRLMDDIVSHKFEQKRGHVASAVECYMKQYGASEEETVAEFQEQVSNAWKDINEEFLRPTAVPMLLLTQVLNLARVMDVLYKDEDGYVHAQIMTKDLVTSVLIDSVPI
ncbi:hypothetical protein F0562_010180 [Nyssa sinensis]|uniref:Terpene synthase metal-binding domain-containing protein n=1 Tax=Nyssa sinensis TaxID=561372 RepID=A0A5J5A356_9ASTE|nr:hypothetical protein F0562_010180 [Nyssa sinensis]